MYSSSSTSTDLSAALSEELIEGLINISSMPRSKVFAEVETLRVQSRLYANPVAAQHLLLFRRYSEVANEIKDNARSQQLDNLNLMGELPSFTYEMNDDKFVGLKALSTNAFWVRLTVAGFAFLSFVVMSTVPFISNADYYAGYSLSVSYFIAALEPFVF
jgi:hypothetical protein